jgi:nicotinamidase-related amidase
MRRALLVIDVQKVYTNPDSELYCADARGTVTRINRLIDRYESKGCPLFFVRHVHKTDGSDLGRMFDYAGDSVTDFNFREGTDEIEYDAKLKRPKSAIEFSKNRYSAFERTDLDRLLRKANVTHVTICGFMTNFCCESTARDAHGRDYFVDFVLDATGTPGTDGLNERKIREVVGELLAAGFCNVMSTRAHLGRRWSNR